MDTVDLVLILLAALALSTIALSALSVRLWRAKEIAQAELARLVAQSRPRSPLKPVAGYDTGLSEMSSLEMKAAE